ncbi:MAG: chemotaxis protein CheB, partial [Actinomycetes bacterium]
MAHVSVSPTSEPLPGGAPVVNSHIQRVVGIGSSAGGLEALQEFLGGLEPGTGSAYVIAQHLAPERPSLIVELLARSTTLPVTTAADGDLLAPDAIVIGPPNADVTVVGDRLRVLAPDERFSPSPSVDLLFTSIAEQWGARSAAVILSGMGSDGAHGLRTVRAAGGLTMVQTPGQARFDGMPQAALALGGVDITADARELGQRLSAISPTATMSAHDSGPHLDGLAGAIAVIKRASGIDFGQYKEPTVRRQVQRRMVVRQVHDIDDYIPLLAADPEEIHALVTRLLVTVTSFFRDPDAFDALRSELTGYLADRDPGDVIRIWVPGCASGEEAYSLAMVVSDILGDPPDLARRLKVFGTDLDETSLAVARKATYAVAAAEHIPADLRSRYTTEQGLDVRIVEALRECVVFARHDVGQDPPFPRMDLVSCRNTLIYFTTTLQDRAVSLMEYSLKTGGLLFLGVAESLGHRNVDFEAVDQTNRIFVRTGGRSAPPSVNRALSTSPIAPSLSAIRRVAVIRDVIPEQHTAMLESLVRTMGHPLVVLDEDHQLVEVVGDVSPFCRLPQGQVTTAVASFLAPELQSEARALLLMCRAEGTNVSGRHIRIDDADVTVQLEAAPLVVGSRRLTLLRFITAGTETEPAATAHTREGDFDRQLERLERELIASQDTLRRSMADLETANEELEASSEELQAASEELQATNEELEASNEELQATNEQLGSMNETLRKRSEEIQLVNTDLENIQSSLNQGMVIVDEDAKVVRFSPVAVRVFGLADNDLGMPITQVPTNIAIPGLGEAVHSVSTGGPRVSIEASGDAGITFVVQVLPYQQDDGRRRGALITLTDVSETSALRRRAELAVLEFGHLTDALDEAVWKRETGMGKVIYVSERMHTLTGWLPEEIIAQEGLLDEAIDPQDREAVALARADESGIWSVQYRVTFPRGGVKWVRETAAEVVGESESYVVGTLADVTELRDLAQTAADTSDIFQTVFDTSTFAVIILDAAYRILNANAAFS